MLQYSSFSLLFVAKLNYYLQINNKFARKLRRSYHWTTKSAVLFLMKSSCFSS
ncbi:hypothetical protein HMPREF9441_01491 [Paraprevotella clara YIT 11840]|uniref:Uncharacterized protein n=1 Tax=Paraprevotella clara YIT 11840 TaxID=762968 RepID=G5SQ54_9BACT|nr:hypothetical protein HMPREF9441_01491 [Paraprevotella clara YIT 11840]